MRIAVVGAGIFGCTVAVEAARARHEVTLYDKRKDIFGGASGRSFYRLHRGFHYPRSPETGLESRLAEQSFRERYGAAVIDGGTQLYVVAPGSKIDGPGFCHFMQRVGLAYGRVLDHELVPGEWVFEVEEPRIDAERLARVALEDIRSIHYPIDIRLGEALPKSARREFDAIIVCAYDGTNRVLAGLGLPSQDYRFQVVEKPLVRMPKEFTGVSVMVIDGPFCCLDPHGDTDLHVLGHVTEAVHHSNTGTEPEVPPALKSWLAKPLAAKSAYSRIDAIVDGVAKFIPQVRNADYVGSMLTIRAVLPNIEATDARPTLVDKIDDQVIRVFSGKIGTAVSAAKQAVSLLQRMERKAA